MFIFAEAQKTYKSVIVKYCKEKGLEAQLDFHTITVGRKKCVSSVKIQGQIFGSQGNLTSAKLVFLPDRYLILN